MILRWCAFLLATAAAVVQGDIASDTWVATDGLGRVLPTAAEVGPPRVNRTVALFYFINHPVRTTMPGPFDISKILAADPAALDKDTSPPWGPKIHHHWWGEPLFGYYCANDPAVLRKHAQMLGDAGVDVIVLDVSNGPTFDEVWRELFRVFAEVRAAGGHTPQIAFFCPFPPHPPYGLRSGEVRHLWETLYRPGLHPELWFRWKGKPLIIAYPSYAATAPAVDGYITSDPSDRKAERLQKGHTLGQSFAANARFGSVRICTPTFGKRPDSAATMRLRRDGPAGEIVAERRFTGIVDNSMLIIEFPEGQPPGKYHIELSAPESQVGWWSQKTAKKGVGGQAYRDGKPCEGTRQFGVEGVVDDEARQILDFFTFRYPLAGYRGEDKSPDGWPWLEVFPQHVYFGSDGKAEVMAVSVAQNANPTRKQPMSVPGAMGRRWHDGGNDPDPGMLAKGPNFQEQWDRALDVAPPAVFVTGWNEWTALRLPEFSGWRQKSGVFVDAFNPEFSRDCEPAKGVWGDAYYWQLVANIRRYKGVRQVSPVASRPIRIDGKFDDWKDVSPEFRDTADDAVRRDFPAWGARAGRYVDLSGRNDIVAAKVSRDGTNICFYVRTRKVLTEPDGDDWMRLFIDIDRDASTGWLGYDFVVERDAFGSGRTVVRRNKGGGSAGAFAWSAPLAELPAARAGNELEIAVPAAAFGTCLRADGFDFKWEDRALQAYDWTDFTLHGDAAPNDRYNFRAIIQ